ncbi:MAG: T9SS type A sorting domain-containing protein [Lishizhenia sp.]
MKYIYCLLISLTVTFFYAQEELSPLTNNPDLFRIEANVKALDNSFDSTFIYKSDTLDLPFFDDFSKNNFQSYSTSFSQSNLSEELYFRLLEETSNTPLPPETKLGVVKTYKITVNTILNTVDTIYYDSTAFQIHNLQDYPVIYGAGFGYPNYIVVDTITATSTTSDTLFTEVVYNQDSARIFIKRLENASQLWLDTNAYHNYRFAVNPISLGVVTFDGLNDKGNAYNIGSSSSAINDKLTSKPLNMGGFAASDSIYFSFLYQPQGFGDAPEDVDSLFVEFWSPTDQLWEKVWRVGGSPLQDFRVGHVKIIDNKYLQDGFQFRFSNLGSVAGAFDQFHVDYVHLRPLSGYQDTLFKDFAIVYPIATLLEEYTQVPWKHYRLSPSGKMSTEMELVVRNNETVAANNSNGGSLKVLLDGVVQGTFTFSGSALSAPDLDYAPRTHYSSLIDLSGAYEYDATLANDTLAVYDYVVETSAQFPNFTQNDSTFGQQIFKAVYAYDDGTAENAYGTTGTQSRLAYKFTSYVEDELVAIQMAFVNTAEDVSNNLFLLTVWDDNNGEPGNVIYQDDFFDPRQPQYIGQPNGFYTYYFKGVDKVAVPQTFYVGWRQIDAERLNIGFDSNTDNQDKIFYSVDNETSWINTSFEGSIMMRPMFSTKLDYQLNAMEQSTEDKLDVQLFPNPSSGYFNVEGDNVEFVEVYSLQGKIILRTEERYFDLSDKEAGVYLVHVYGKDGESRITKKIIKK